MLFYKINYTDNEGDNKVCRVFGEKKRDTALKNAQARGYRVHSVIKMYPVASWERNQHVFYNLCDRMANAYYDSNSEEDYDRWQEAQRLCGAFDCGPQDANGVVYAEYEDYKAMKDFIGGYAYRHGGRV